jgi:hypothetical protein
MLARSPAVEHTDTETFHGRRIQETEDRRQKTEDRRQKTEDRRQETEDRRQKTGDRRQETGEAPALIKETGDSMAVLR